MLAAGMLKGFQRLIESAGPRRVGIAAAGLAVLLVLLGAGVTGITYIFVNHLGPFASYP